MYCLQGVVKKRLQGVVKKIVCRVQKKSWAAGCRSAGCHVRLTVQTKRSSAGCILGLVMYAVMKKYGEMVEQEKQKNQIELMSDPDHLRNYGWILTDLVTGWF